MKCHKIIRDSYGRPVSYVIEQNNGIIQEIPKDRVKAYLKTGKTIENLKYTKDNRIIASKNSSETYIKLYHGSPNKLIILDRNKGESKHDYGKGFYMTPNKELAKEWAVCNTDENGYIHSYVLDTKNLKILDFQKYSVLNWLAELMSHRSADNSMGYKKNAEIFISKFKINTDKYDVIKGWRADASYFFIAKQFVRNNISYNVLEELLKAGSLGIQYCIKSEKAFNQTREIKTELAEVDVQLYKQKYINRDTYAREEMRKVVESDRNTYENRFIDIIKE